MHVLPHAYPLGGTERSVLDLLESPVLVELNQRVAFLRQGPLGPFRPDAVLPLHRVVVSRPRVLHGWLLRGNAFAATVGALVRETVVMTSERNLGHNLTPAKRVLERFVATREIVCVANSRAVAEAASSRVPGRRGRMRVIRPGIAAPPRTGPRQDVACTAVGRLEPVKDHATLVRAWALVCQRHPKAKLVVVGEGPERPRLERLAAKLDLAEAIAFPGAGDPFPYLRGATVYASSSRAEGFSRALIEAMALGKPIVATAVGGAVELPAAAAVVVPPGDEAAMADAICSFLREDGNGERAGTAALAEYERAYTADQCHRAYGELYSAFVR